MSEAQQLKYINARIFINAIDKVLEMHGLSPVCREELTAKKLWIEEKIKEE